MTVKELKEKIKDLPDDTEVKIDFEFFSGELGWGDFEQEEHDVEETHFFDWSAINSPCEFHLSTFKEESEKGA